MGFELGYGLSDNIVLGASVLFWYKTESEEDADESTDGLNINLFPHLDYVFSEGSSARPFIGILAGISSDSVSQGDTDISSFSFGFGLRGGLHLFVAESFSIDPLLQFVYGIGSYESDAMFGTAEGDINTLLVDVMLGLSGWI